MEGLPDNRWEAWTSLGPYTWGWIVWVVWFFVLEAWAIMGTGYLGTLTAHLRPVFAEHPLAFFLALGAYLWLGFHFFVEGVFIVPWGAR